MDGSTIVEDTITGLINAGLIKDEDRKDICDTWVFNAKYSYPTPSVERDEILAGSFRSWSSTASTAAADSACGSMKSPIPITRSCRASSW